MTPPLSNFAGAWSFAREITHANGDLAQVTGQATFSATGDDFTYSETGQMSVNGGPPLTATRAYIWQKDGTILFEDGRPFHSLPSDGAEAVHLCDPDTYRVTYDFTGWPIWRSTWRVTGPRKDYVMVTVYRRPRA